MTRGLKHQEVMNLLRTAPDEVTLLVCRPSEMDLPKIESVTSELEVLGTTSPIAHVNTDALEGPATYSDIDDMMSARESICSQSVSIQPPHDNQSVKAASFQDQSLVSSSGDYVDEDQDTPRATPAPQDNRDQSQDKLNHSQDKLNHLEDKMNRSVRSVQNTSSHTPSPVTQFLHDAGLSDVDSIAAATPSVDHSVDDDDDYDDDREYEITLTKGEKGLGFTIAGSHHIDGYFYVKDVLYDPARSCGQIASGHRLMVVDGQDMTELNHREAVGFLRQTESTVTLRYYIPTPKEREIAEAKATAPKSFKDNFKAGDLPQSTSTPRESIDPQNTSTPREPVNQHASQSNTRSASTKTINQSTPRETVVTPAGQKQHNLNTSNNSSGNAADDATDHDDSSEGGLLSTASSFGTMSLPMPGDMPEENVSSRSQPSEDTSSGKSPRSEDRSMASLESGVLRMTLNRKDAGYGFSLIHGERGTSTALFVRTITPGGAADDDGQLHVRDRLLQVNGESVIGMAHNKAITLIKNSSDYVQLTVTRSTPSTTPTPIRDLDLSTPQPLHSVKLPEPTRDTGSGPVYSGTVQDNHNDEETPESRLSREGQLAFLRLVDGQKGRGSESESDDSWGGGAEDESSAEEGDVEEEEAPQKPPRKKPFSRLPPEISNSWLESLPLVQPPSDTVHYSGRQLQTIIKQLRARLSNDDPLEEYKVLKHAKLTDNCLEARKQENKSKNRYRNVLPYDANRVKLSGPEDYINASHVCTSVGTDRRTYIASQGPLPHTTGDFWRMVWEQRIEVIAMVTRDVEDNKVKCHRYWPDSVAEPFTVWDRYEISLVQVHHLMHFDVHHIKMEDRKTGSVHRVMHVAFSTWPDQGVPESSIPLLRYIQFARLVHQSGAMLVHCSAGIGRTGALITLDVIMAMIDKGLKFDIQKIVQDLRRQRQGMIQVMDQYKFCYQAALEVLESLNS